MMKMRLRVGFPVLSLSILVSVSIGLGTNTVLGQPPTPGIASSNTASGSNHPASNSNHPASNSNHPGGNPGHAPSANPAPGQPLTGSAQATGTAEPHPSKEQLIKGTANIVSSYHGSWRMFLQNPCHTGSGTVNGQFLPKGQLKWTFPAEGPIDSSPAVYKGVVYVGSDDGFLYAIDQRNGRMLWHTQLGDKVKSSPAVTDQILVVGCEDKKVYGIDPKSGAIKWTVPTGDRVSSSPAIYEGVVYLGSWDGHVYALNLKDGAKLWSFPKEDTLIPGGTEPLKIGRITASPALAPGVVLVASHGAGEHDGSVY